MSRNSAAPVARSGPARTAFSILVGVAIVAVVALLSRVWMSPETATAQQPSRNAGQTSRPAVNTAAGQDTAAQSRRQSKAIPPVVAVVNGQEITRQQLGQECLRRYADDVLESIVNKHLIWQECQKHNVAITDQDVEEEINRIAGKFGLSADRWLAMLEQEREITPNQYRREIIWPTIALRHLAAKQLEVSEQELREAFENEYGPKMKVRLISVSSRGKAEEVLAKAQANADAFPELAKEHSEDASASVQGMIPPIRRHMGMPEVEQAAFALQEGEVSPIIQVANQYLILKCEKQIPATYIADKFRQDAEERLLDRIRDQKMRNAAAELFQRLQKEARVVNIYNDPAQRGKMPGVAATINGQPLPIEQVQEECLIRYGKEVLEGEINRVILLQALDRVGRQVSEADIDDEIARAAEAYGVIKEDGTPDIEAWLKKVTQEDEATVELYVRDAVWPTAALKKLVNTKIEVTAEDLSRGFQANYGPRVEILAIVLPNQRQAQRVWEMARGNPTDRFFGELAHQYSVDPVSKENMGKVPPVRRFGGQPAIEDEAFKLKPGEMSGIIAVGESYIILRCQGYTEPVVTKMDETIRQELYKEIYERKLRSAMTARFDEIHEQARVQNLLAGSAVGVQSARPRSGVAR